METHPNQRILRTSGKVLAIWGETDRTDVQISLLGDAFVVEDKYQRTSVYIGNLVVRLHPIASHNLSLLKGTNIRRSCGRTGCIYTLLPVYWERCGVHSR